VNEPPLDLNAPPPPEVSEPPPFLQFVRDSGLARMREGASLTDVSHCLDALARLVVQCTSAQTLALVREHAIRLVKATGLVDSPAKLVDAHLPRVRRDAEEEKQGNAVLFPASDPWHEPVGTSELLAELTATVARFVVLPPGAATAVALWILHSHAIDAAQMTPRLAILSPLKRCGKSTLLKLLAALVHSPLFTASLTAAALFRVVEAHAPTLLVDEADTFMHDNEELRGMLNAGHDRQSATTVRCVGEDYEPRTFRVWAPVAIAAIGKIPDTVMDRSIVVLMKRKAHGESAQRFRRRERATLVDLRRRCERWALDFAPTLADANPAFPEELNDRAADNWEPLLAIADLAGAPWALRARRAALGLSGEAGGEDAATQGEALLGDVRAVFEARKADRLSTKTLLDDLTRMEGRPWAEANRGRPLSSNGLAKLLRGFDVSPGSIRMQDGSNSTPKGYMRAAFEDPWTRYLPPTASATAATSPDLHANPNGSETPRAHRVADGVPEESAKDLHRVAAVAPGNAARVQP